jgi:hypothetical protein
MTTQQQLVFPFTIAVERAPRPRQHRDGTPCIHRSECFHLYDFEGGPHVVLRPHASTYFGALTYESARMLADRLAESQGYSKSWNCTHTASLSTIKRYARIIELLRIHGHSLVTSDPRHRRRLNPLGTAMAARQRVLRLLRRPLCLFAPGRPRLDGGGRGRWAASARAWAEGRGGGSCESRSDSRGLRKLV